jgi:hypothetical protein
MIWKIPLEITHLRHRLRQDFTDKLPEATFGSSEEKERNFLSRALAAFAVQRLSGCSTDEAVAAVVDGGGDSGIDAIQYLPLSHKLWIVQSKFLADGQGEPSLGDVSKFKNGLEALLRGQFEVFRGNATLARRIPRQRPSPLCVACGADGARPAWRSTELSPAAGVRVRLGRAPSGDTGEVRGGAGGWARVTSGCIFPILCSR